MARWSCVSCGTVATRRPKDWPRHERRRRATATPEFQAPLPEKIDWLHPYQRRRPSRALRGICPACAAERPSLVRRWDGGEPFEDAEPLGGLVDAARRAPGGDQEE